MEPELGQNREVSFLTSKRSFSTEKTTPRQNSGFTKTVLKPEMPFIFGVMGNEEWVVKKLRPRALLYSSLRSKISGRANNEIQSSLLFPFWVMMCNAESTWKQTLSLSMKLFSQLLDNVILPASSHFPQEIAYSYLQLMKTSYNTLFHEKQTAPVLSLFITNAKYNLKSISAGLLTQMPWGQHCGFLHAITHRMSIRTGMVKLPKTRATILLLLSKCCIRAGCKPLDPTARLRTPRLVRHHMWQIR